VTQFASNALGLDSLVSGTYNLTKIAESESSSTDPVLFITTPGADPSQELRDFAYKTVSETNFIEVIYQST
jgi:dynein heavy chain 2